ncbi:hypothetical protein [Bradyrhizobium sp. CB2312]|uniref:hypothetical protein n=1 Tax=Bradyrhizobium sp. CB2312 TaxID=3039155 RepID=UPI0024B0DAD3|nr:hypothetical protein [Bradyrhizobium sp. CB2312]WFU75535.1 hypothetical protein QA642_16780 [Bradyrhizobium sp. CB2312]
MVMNSEGPTAPGPASVIASVAALAVVSLATPPPSQAQTTGQLLISAGFNPVAATTSEAMTRLRSFPAKQFLRREKAGRPYYFYADPAGCGCAYVGTVAAMNKYASFGVLPAAAPPGGVSLEQDMINSMNDDDAGAHLNEDVFGPDP